MSRTIRGYQRPDFEQVARVDQEWKRARRQDFRENLRIYEALWEEAVARGAFEGTDALAHLDVDIRLAHTLNL